MTKQTFIDSINRWLNKRYSNEQISEWILFAEDRISQELRVKDMIAIDVGTIMTRRCTLPSDWRELDFVHYLDGKPLEFKSRTEFYRIGADNAKDIYTITGNFIIVGGPIDAVNGTKIEISYYEDVPRFTEADTWLYIRYPRLLTAATLSAGQAFGLDDERAVLWETETKNRIETLNIEHLRSRNSGSRLASARKGFG